LVTVDLGGVVVATGAGSMTLLRDENGELKGRREPCQSDIV
jgi:hypothetical protein